MGQCRRQQRWLPSSLPIGRAWTHMRVHAPTCVSQTGGTLPTIIRFRLLRDNGNLYDWPAEFGLRGAHSTVAVSVVCLPGLPAGDHFLSIAAPPTA